MLQSLALTREGVDDFVEHPLEFLLGVIKGLDAPGRATLCVVFLAGGFVEAPLELSPPQERALTLMGATEASCREALSALEGSMLTFLSTGSAQGWRVRHPTVLEAVARMVADDPGLLDIYIAGAPTDDLISEVTIGETTIEGVSVRVPASRHELILERLDQEFDDHTHTDYMLFLATRCSPEFLAAWIERHPDLLARMCQYRQMGGVVNSRVLLVKRLHDYGLLTDANRQVFLTTLQEAAVADGDIAFWGSEDVKAILHPEELEATIQIIREKVIPELDALVDSYSRDIDPDDDIDSFLAPLFESLDAYEELWSNDPEAKAELRDARISADLLEEELQDTQRQKREEEYEPDWDDIDRDYPEGDSPERSIFDDIDA